MGPQQGLTEARIEVHEVRLTGIQAACLESLSRDHATLLKGLLHHCVHCTIGPGISMWDEAAADMAVEAAQRCHEAEREGGKGCITRFVSNLRPLGEAGDLEGKNITTKGRPTRGRETKEKRGEKRVLGKGRERGVQSCCFLLGFSPI